MLERIEQLRRDAEAEISAADTAESLEEMRVRHLGRKAALPQPIGRLHLLTATMRELEDIFLGLGFTVIEGPEVETVHYNFDALNHSPTHPARAPSDTFYVEARPDGSE